ncbi:MAG: ATP-binding cassette domain-containing protein, partial [Bacteroidales bacterium]|nr:ATP-binding cassette domain-containing protein [Bacteroidales bacterium]
MLRVQNINKKYDEFFLQEICLEVPEGGYFVLLGPSGAGKTILFETIAGLINPDSGSILLDGRDITTLPISKRDVGIVFQDSAVFPHMTVRQNLSYALKSKKLKKNEISAIIEGLAKKVGISNLLHRKPSSLSGGELKRVAIARTLALKPKILLLDEPLASLDVQLKQEIRDLLKALYKNGQTILHITHDYNEAFNLASEMAIMDRGKIIQRGTAIEVYSKPGNHFVASFMGIKNYFRFKTATEQKIIIEDAVSVKVNQSSPEQGYIV